MKFSHGLANLMAPLTCFFWGKVSDDEHWNFIMSIARLKEAIKKMGKRGPLGTYYPTDFKRVSLVLECTHECGVTFSQQVHDGDIQAAIDKLSNAVRFYDCLTVSRKNIAA